jgi:hypothetical protein
MVEYSKRSSTGNPFPLFLTKQARKETFPWWCKILEVNFCQHVAQLNLSFSC